jgi:hypothetical protein
MKHFKHQRTLETGIYTGRPYCGTAKEGRQVLGKMQLSCPNEDGLTAALWTDAVIDAYTNVSTVEKMLESLPEWQEAVKREDSYRVLPAGV